MVKNIWRVSLLAAGTVLVQEQLLYVHQHGVALMKRNLMNRSSDHCRPHLEKPHMFRKAGSSGPRRPCACRPTGLRQKLLHNFPQGNSASNFVPCAFQHARRYCGITKRLSSSRYSRHRRAQGTNNQLRRVTAQPPPFPYIFSLDFFTRIALVIYAWTYSSSPME